MRMLSVLKRRLAVVTATALLLLVTAWWLSGLGHPPPRWASRLLLLGAGLCTAALCLAFARRLWTGAGHLTKLEGRVLLLLLGLAFATSFVGLDHEIGGLYFADEGIFLAQAQRINRGQLLKGWFVYPHLLFYLDAFALWAASLVAPAVKVLARLLYGIEGDLYVASLVTLGVTATLGALTVVPTFALARRLAGLPAAALAGTLIALSPIYLEVSHLNLADVPGAFFATVALAVVAALVERESLAGYLGAGVAAGLAAGGKYPAGTVALAIAAVWLCWRLRGWRLRGWRPRQGRQAGATAEAPALQPLGLAWAALAALTAFVATTPSLLAYPRAAAGGGADVLFGVRLYAQHGWPGVVHASNLGFYGRELAASFGLVALGLGLSGLFLASRESRRRLAWMLPFPLAYLALLLAMKIAVRRNLMPVLPILCALLAVGIAAWAERLARLRALSAWGPGRRLATAAVALLALAFPATISAGHLLRAAHATTREAAAAWVRAHAPPGSHFVQEAYTPELGSAERYVSRRPRLAIRVPREELEDGRYDFLLLASDAYGRFLRPDHAADPARAGPANRYRDLFGRYELLHLWQPNGRQSGPELRLYRLDPQPPRFAGAVRFTAADGWPSDDAMRASAEAPLAYSEPGQWSLFRAYLAAGTYRLEAQGEALAGRVRVLNRANQPIAAAALAPAGGSAEITLPRDDKYFLYLELEPGARLVGVGAALSRR